MTDDRSGDERAGDGPRGDERARGVRRGDDRAGGVRTGDERAGDGRVGGVRVGGVRKGGVRKGDERKGDERKGSERAGDVRKGRVVRGTLSAGSIAASALALGDQEGPEAMTARRIAAYVGCDPMTLYRHFANLVALLDAVADLAVGDVVLPDDRAPWVVRLRETVANSREVALAHPGIAPHIASRPPLGPHGQQIGRILLGALRDAGLSDEDTVATSQVLIAYLSSSIAMAVATQGQRDDRWTEAAHALRSIGQNSTEQMPAAGSIEQFTLGLDLLVDGLRMRTNTAHLP
ncbi:TetR/AcrR family transcriptional regulator [Kribbella speibonae]|uniref:TetR family transcriptional regulator n=1 Tax=Kribbella speibonae TaxID=1572660 RepID=A0ABY2A244_9ACTN|nr:TetR/AcrR family transcriptional regulator C-terminal domain-containing protein [Kribbella speibonae]TCC22110.1 TetR family transcriptional regulator [Kribbella speibonae]